MRRRMPAGQINFYNETRIKIHRYSYFFTRLDERVRDRMNLTDWLAAVFGEENASRKGCDNQKFYSCQVAMHQQCDGPSHSEQQATEIPTLNTVPNSDNNGYIPYSLTPKKH